MKHRRLLPALFFLASILSFNCQSGTSAPTAPGTGSIPVRLVFPDGANGIYRAMQEDSISSAAGDASCLQCDHIDFVVSGNGMADIPFDGIDYSLHQAMLGGIPAGDGRTVVANVYDAVNTLLYTGGISGISVPAGSQSEPQVIVMSAADKGDWFVRADAAPGGDGKSWATAFNNIQDAIKAATAGEKVFVAEGIYTDLVALPVVIMRVGVELYGGFAGTERYLSERGDPEDHPTILDGRDFSSHVVVGASNSRLDGFIITGGRAYPDFPETICDTTGVPPNECVGGGLFNSQVTGMSIANCVFRNNTAYYGGAISNDLFSLVEITDSKFQNNRAIGALAQGGAILVARSNVDISDCSFSGNAGMNGGAIYNYYSSTTVTSSDFTRNLATSETGGGGAIYSDSYSANVAVNCIFNENSGTLGGAANNDSSGSIFIGCSFSGNNAKTGGAIYGFYGLIQAVNCSMSGNSAWQYSGGIYATETENLITNNVIWGNTAPTSPEIFLNTSLSSTLAYNDIGDDLWATGVGTINQDPLFVGASLHNLRLQTGSPCIDAGDPSSEYNDPDGSRNDMGAFGGQDSDFDTDRDGISDNAESITTEPFTDANDNGVYDAGESFTDLNGNTQFDALDKLDPSDATGDFDSDSMTNLEEFYRGSDMFVANPSILYVDDAATGAGDGTSWAHAFTNIQDAVDAAPYGASVFVKQGVFAEEKTPMLVMKKGVNLYGGFIGTETALGQRGDPMLTPTVLDGQNTMANGGPGYPIVVGASEARLDGFVVTNGATYTNGGAGMYNAYADNLFVANCKFSVNTAIDSDGAAIYNLFSNITVTDSEFTGNLCDYLPGGTAALGGGAIFNNRSSPTIANCVFSANRYSSNSMDYGGGGAMFNYYSSPAITDSVFDNNIVIFDAQGGAIRNKSSSPTITNCVFSGNSAKQGGAIYDLNSSSTITGCIFGGNSTEEFVGYGGGFAGKTSTPLITNSFFINNRAPDGAGVYTFEFSDSSIIGCVFNHNSANDGGGGLASLNSFIDVSDSIFSGNYAGSGGGIHIQANIFPTITNCLIVGNLAISQGGGLYSSGYVTSMNNTFSSNKAATGSGIYETGATIPITNSILWRDDPAGGEIAWAFTPNVNVTYSDVDGGPFPGAGNLAVDPLFSRFPAAPDGSWTNDPFYDPVTMQSTFIDTTQSFKPGGLAGMFLNPDPSSNRQYLIVGNTANSITIWGEVDFNTPLGDNFTIYDYHLGAGSPLRDVGTNTSAPAIDLDGNPRPYNAITDMGAYEYSLP